MIEGSVQGSNLRQRCSLQIVPRVRLVERLSQIGRILIVDDEASIRLSLSALLERTGYEVTSAENGEEAVVVLEQQAFDLLLVDLKMPGMDGMQVVAAARQRQPAEHIITIGALKLDSRRQIATQAGRTYPSPRLSFVCCCAWPNTPAPWYPMSIWCAAHRAMAPMRWRWAN